MIPELKTMNDTDLAMRVLNYIECLDQLLGLITKFHEGEYDLSLIIYEDYKRLKSEVKRDAHYFGLVVNGKGQAKHYKDVSRSIREAAAYGFTASTNSKINSKFSSAIYEARYKLGKCYPKTILDEQLLAVNSLEKR